MDIAWHLFLVHISVCTCNYAALVSTALSTVSKHTTTTTTHVQVLTSKPNFSRNDYEVF